MSGQRNLTNPQRRRFLQRTSRVGLAAWTAGASWACSGDSNTDTGTQEISEEHPDAPPATKSALFSISLAQWSLHRAFFGPAIASGDFQERLQRAPDSVLEGEWQAIDFPTIAREQYGIEAVEYVNTFFFDKANDPAYLAELKRRADDAGVTSLLIMCDALGRLGDPDDAARASAADRHKVWLDAAVFLGCHSIRVNAASSGTFEEQQRLAADGLRAVADSADERGLNVLVENHGGLSSNGSWLAGVMRSADHPRLGTLPDFGNFRLDDNDFYDRYLGVEELMPFAKAVSAKSHDFDTEGRETSTDYERMMRIVLDAGYRGFVGIEYEGATLAESEGILATKSLLEATRARVAEDYA